MNRLSPWTVLVALAGLACPAPARAHFIWLLPADTRSVRAVFSETLRADDPELLPKIAGTKFFARGTDGKANGLEAKRDKDALAANVPGEGLREVAGVCQYGVLQRGKSEPFLLHYYPKTFVGLSFDGAPLPLFAAAWDRLALEIVPLVDHPQPTVQVLWQGKPLAGAAVVLLPPGAAKGVEAKADKDGLVKLAEPKKMGLYGIRARHTEARSGEEGGKKYKEVHHYATLTLPVPENAVGESASKPARATAEDKPEANPAATRLLADARAARALYHHFPGFAADIEVNTDGKVVHGQAKVSASGKVTIESDNTDESGRWAIRTLASIIAHRLDSGSAEGNTPCAFADDDAHHPLGRAIRVLNDEFHSSYRIRDHQVIVVNRQMPDSRFTITVMENVRNRDKQFLPACYVVNTWDKKSDALKSSETHHQTWQRVGAFDLPVQTTVVIATAGKLEARSIKLSNFELAK